MRILLEYIQRNENLRIQHLKAGFRDLADGTHNPVHNGVESHITNDLSNIFHKAGLFWPEYRESVIPRLWRA
jgi:hypothetical protein